MLLYATRITARFRRAVVASKSKRVKPLRLRKGPPDAPRLRFWFKLAWQTLTRRSIIGLSREMADPFRYTGLDNLPEQGNFVLAVNHTNVRWTPRVLASIHQASLCRRPELAGQWLVVVGNRALRLERMQPWQRLIAVQVRRVFEGIYDRWDYNCLRLPMGNDKASLKALRAWRNRAQKQPSVVFPEGRGSPTFKEVRPGAGRWLASLGLPIIPVAVWWDEAGNYWRLDFGAGIEWAKQTSLHDLQLGLAIADALPPAEAPDWQAGLIRWRAAHLYPLTTSEPIV